MHSILARLQACGWAVEPPSPGASFPDAIAACYGPLPDPLAAFMGSFSRCTDPSECAWLVSSGDFLRDEAFRFDAFERMSLEAAAGDVDAERAIVAFWTAHLPLLLSVRGAYQFFAIRLAGPDRGCVVHGCEPEFEEVSIVARSLDAFLDALCASQESPAPSYPYDVAVAHNRV